MLYTITIYITSAMRLRKKRLRKAFASKNSLYARNLVI
jgi:hypothetical protein